MLNAWYNMTPLKTVVLTLKKAMVGSFGEAERVQKHLGLGAVSINLSDYMAVSQWRVCACYWPWWYPWGLRLQCCGSRYLYV